MRTLALGLLVAVTASLPGHAAEPDGLPGLINEKEALRIGIQGLVSAKARDTASRKAQKDALIEYYLVSEQPLLWVDENGLTERAKQVMAEIGKADDYGLTASDYSLARSRRLQRLRSQGARLARRCRGEGQLCRARLCQRRARRPHRAAAAEQESRSERLRCPIRRRCWNRSPSAPTPPPISGASSPTSRNSRRSGRSCSSSEAARSRSRSPTWSSSRDGPVLKFGVENEQVALLRKRLDVPAGANPRRSSTKPCSRR